MMFRKVGDSAVGIVRFRIVLFGPQNLFALQSHRELNTANSSRRKVQGANDVLSQFIAGLEQAESSNFSSPIRDYIEIWPPPCSDILQVLQSNLHFWNGPVILQERVCWSQLLVGDITRNRLLLWLIFNQQRKDSYWNVEQLHLRAKSLSGNANLVVIFDVLASVSWRWLNWNLLTIVIYKKDVINRILE